MSRILREILVGQVHKGHTNETFQVVALWFKPFLILQPRPGVDLIFITIRTTKIKVKKCNVNWIFS